MTQPTRAQLRQFISKHFDDSELMTFCFDYFPTVSEDYTDGMRKSVKILQLIEYSERHGKYDDLVVNVERERSNVFKEKFGIVHTPMQSGLQVLNETKRISKQIFLSHSTKDGVFAKQLADELKTEGWSVWIAPESIIAGEKWVDAIQRGLDESSIFILLISPDAVASQWVKSETNAAIGLEHEGDMRIVPLLYKPAKLPSLWGNYHAVTCKAINAQSLNNLFQALEFESLKPARSKNRVATQESAGKELGPQEKEPPTNFAMLFIAAEKAYETGDVAKAVGLYKQIVDAEPEGVWGENASEKISKIVNLARKEKQYSKLKEIADQSLEAGLIEWSEFAKEFPKYDPDNIFGKVSAPLLPSNYEEVRKSSQRVMDAFHSVYPRIKGFQFKLPDPFAWVEIPNQGYSISKYPITNGQFAEFINDGGYKTNKWWTEEGLKYRNDNRWSKPRFWQDKTWNGINHPVVGVSWFEAVAFCLWVSDKVGGKIMLPSEDQWQYAAQGTDNRIYPWGDKWNGSKCNHNVDQKGVGETTPVTQFEGKGDSLFGVVDMSGNVWEWCLTDYDKKTNDVDAEAEQRVLRGGSWYHANSYYFVVSNRSLFTPNYGGDDIGFRVALSS